MFVCLQRISPEYQNFKSWNFACVIYPPYGKFLRKNIREIEQKSQFIFCSICERPPEATLLEPKVPSNIFTSFSPKFFLTIFLVKSKLSTAKKSKTTTFSRVFYPKKVDNFLGKSKLNFWTKNEHFEQCAYPNLNRT